VAQLDDQLSPKQREIREREELILDVAREMFFEEGYYNLTMAKIAHRINCAKGTVYLHFPCKEDIIVVLAERAQQHRYTMLQRAMSFQGRSRERMLAFALAGAYYARLYPGDMQIIKTITPSFREKVSTQREERFEEVEQRVLDYLMQMVNQGVTEGDLILQPGMSVGKIVWGLWSLADGGFGIILSGVSLQGLGIQDPWALLVTFMNKLSDSLDWRPISSEWDYDASLDRIRREVFAEEARQLEELSANP
jgi:AcrR family transcriptional regulator